MSNYTNINLKKEGEFNVLNRDREKKEFIVISKIRAEVEKLKIDAIKKEIQKNKSNYSVKELEIFDKLLQEAIKNYDSYSETYSKGSIIFGIEDFKLKYKDI